ncbi:MAG TPA: ATP-binding protein [Nitrospirota bacterium]|nr:ATP-binding protein [Nitrospirota bacterium]
MSFSSLREKDFLDRQAELNGLFKRVLQADAGAAQSIVLSGPRGVGKTELLKQLFGLLYWTQERVAPFFYTVNPALISAAAFSRDYLIAFLCQRLAFQKKEQALLDHSGMTLEGLRLVAEDHDAAWVKELIDRYIQSSATPVDALRVALAAPRRSALATGMAVAVLVDNFHWLNALRLEGVPDHNAVSFFSEPLTFGKTPYVIAGNTTELLEMPATSGLERMQVRPLGPAGTQSRVQTLLSSMDAGGSVPHLLLRRLGGNPLYLGRVIARSCGLANPDEKDFWNAYIQEVMDGGLFLFWSAALKSAFPDLRLRRTALAILYKIYHAAEPLSSAQIASSFSLAEVLADDIAHTLYLAEFIRGEFGVFRATDDLVLRDIVDCLYLKEILAKSPRDLEQELRATLLPQKEQSVRFDLTLPMTREAELVAAQCLEQIGKNLHLNPDAVGQMQIAMIEACINAMEHSRGAERKVYVCIVADKSQVEVSVESTGREFILQETGEPYGERDSSHPANRGWGLKLIKRFADQVKFEKTAAGTKIVLLKLIGSPADLQREDAPNRD